MSGMQSYLTLMVESGASDLFISSGSPLYLKIDGATRAIDSKILAAGEVKNLAYGMMSLAQQTMFEKTLESNFAFVVEGVGRYRVNVYFQRGEVAMAIRLIKSDIPGLETLGLPSELIELTMLQRGLILIVGAGGSGKSTTLATYDRLSRQSR